jgi:phosphoribosylamine--glycine ligase
MAWRLAQSGATVTSAPGNPGLAEVGDTLALVPDDPVAIAEAAVDFDLVVIGPEAPLAIGVADAVRAAGVPCLGPGSDGAQLEASKTFAKDVMLAAGIPTARYFAVSNLETALKALEEMAPGPYVVKADGLAAGKGVLVTTERDEAEAWARACFDGRFEEAGDLVVVEEFLDGPELSVFVVTDGKTVVPLATARDYKRLGNGGSGPNTGGMGCFSPVPLPDGLVDEVLTSVIRPVLAELVDRGIDYRGFLYTGLVLTEDGPKVLEFNCRLGDPETQVVLPRLRGDFAQLLLAAATAQGLAEVPIKWWEKAAVDVVLAAPGYPVSTSTGDPIHGLNLLTHLDDVLVFHSGTRRKGDEVITSGGRVLNVVGMGEDLAEARRTAYDAAALVAFEGKQYRTDIAKEAEEQ